MFMLLGLHLHPAREHGRERGAQVPRSDDPGAVKGTSFPDLRSLHLADGCLASGYGSHAAEVLVLGLAGFLDPF